MFAEQGASFGVRFGSRIYATEEQYIEAQPQKSTYPRLKVQDTGRL